MQPGVVPESKPDESPVTEADRECERAIAGMLESAFPGDGIFGEEGARAESRTGRRWIIDPIDGTRDFVRHNPLWANLIALEEGGEVVLGVVHLPVLGWLCHGVKGGGAFRNGQRMRVSARTAIEDSVLCANDQRSLARAPFADRLLAWMARFWAVRGLGGAADAMMVSAGEAEVWIEPHAKPWDYAPIKVIAEEAGARFFSFRGAASIYDESGVVCVPALEDEVRGFLVEEHRRT
jgi:fructose-1,6-bisphosphatase/inositol monophosphatase family enzyme